QAVPDIVVAHEPAAAIDVAKAGIRINGHMHRAELDGSRVGVGTFTGGGPFSHFIAGPHDELTGQPSAFDVATFGQDCRLTSLTRYQFRNVIEGRPAYDDVTLVNGSRIESEAPPSTSAATTPAGAATTPPRSCSTTMDTTTEHVPADSP
ncbi:MAG TPA: metallophosphoesterase, partial [Pedococcus sp.]|nr:metallophosphoesterase [Pedococcus sp.]